MKGRLLGNVAGASFN